MCSHRLSSEEILCEYYVQAQYSFFVIQYNSLLVLYFLDWRLHKHAVVDSLLSHVGVSVVPVEHIFARLLSNVRPLNDISGGVFVVRVDFFSLRVLFVVDTKSNVVAFKGPFPSNERLALVDFDHNFVLVLVRHDHFFQVSNVLRVQPSECASSSDGVLLARATQIVWNVFRADDLVEDFEVVWSNNFELSNSSWVQPWSNQLPEHHKDTRAVDNVHLS
mmetsp:Transcript_722/g.992  ORF Transcript_722/g.992 Transcript_722/m.992 type:complete len:219 (-) Transcript_722:744-1400(-)